MWRETPCGDKAARWFAITSITRVPRKTAFLPKRRRQTMTRCLDEATLQSYFDGELSIQMMESVTSHLASCVTCAAAARQLEEETELLNSALAAEFEASVPTDLLRQRIDAAVLGERTAIAQANEKSSGLAAFFSSLFNFGTQRTLGYASLAVVVAFAVIAG